ncbi:unnamed protein product [Rotaria sp. Silwood2]|nr:unnamed protein product [Rotaria sp. Silwood2]CAF2757545.1 unnamed protein product [Rotaria sp. Silwood2]CAF4444356.1 unnamed protein product [Rotaria sp. Silwood2]CAF4457397.1 unnamed protein product [Rotaria sp. Silwood2]CAF4503339.1 unnamed protein product [Rotaria sp. Silwood2]
MNMSINNKIADHTVGQLRSKVLNADEVASNVFIFITAGYEIVSTILAYCTYVLTTKSDIQAKFISEINQNPSDGIDKECIDDVNMNVI